MCTDITPLRETSLIAPVKAIGDNIFRDLFFKILQNRKTLKKHVQTNNKYKSIATI